MTESLTQQIIQSHYGKIIPDTLFLENSNAVTAFQLFLSMRRERMIISQVIIAEDLYVNEADERYADERKFLKSLAMHYECYLSSLGSGIGVVRAQSSLIKAGSIIIGSDPYLLHFAGLGTLTLRLEPIDLIPHMVMKSPMALNYKIVAIELLGKLPRFLSATDLAFEIIRRMGPHLFAPTILEFIGEGVSALTVSERSEIARMLANSNILSVVFPSDDQTKRFLADHNRGEEYIEILPPNKSNYEKVVEIDISSLDPLMVVDRSFKKILHVGEWAQRPVDQVVLGGAGATLKQFILAASVLECNSPHFATSFILLVPTKELLIELVEAGLMTIFLKKGARVVEPSLAYSFALAGMIQKGQFSVRSLERLPPDFETQESVLVSFESALATLIRGTLTSAFELEQMAQTTLLPLPSECKVKWLPERRLTNTISYGALIPPHPEFRPRVPEQKGEVLLKLGDYVNAAQLLILNSETTKLRFNIKALAPYFLKEIDPTFYPRSLEKNGGILIAGKLFGEDTIFESYGLIARYLGIQAVVAKSFDPRMRKLLMTFGVAPLLFKNSEDYELLEMGDELLFTFDSLLGQEFPLKLSQKDLTIVAFHDWSEEERLLIIKGGMASLIRSTHF